MDFNDLFEGKTDVWGRFVLEKHLSGWTTSVPSWEADFVSFHLTASGNVSSDDVVLPDRATAVMAVANRLALREEGVLLTRLLERVYLRWGHAEAAVALLQGDESAALDTVTQRHFHIYMRLAEEVAAVTLDIRRTWWPSLSATDLTVFAGKWPEMRSCSKFKAVRVPKHLAEPSEVERDAMAHGCPVFVAEDSAKPILVPTGISPEQCADWFGSLFALAKAREVAYELSDQVLQLHRAYGPLTSECRRACRVARMMDSNPNIRVKIAPRA